MGYTKEYVIGFFEFLFGLFGLFIIVLWAFPKPNQCLRG